MSSPTKTVSRKFAILGVAAASAAAAAIIAVPAPAQADLPTGPGGGRCSVVPSWSQPSSGTLKLTYTANCSVLVEEIYFGLTVQRGGTVNTGGGSCYQSYTCTKSVTIGDPAGSQYFEGHNEVQVRWYPTTRTPSRGLYNTGTTS